MHMAVSLETLQEVAAGAKEILRECTLCPRNCRVNRLKDQLGCCEIGSQAKVSSFGPHFGEEPPLVGRCGSGTIFFSRCNLRCLFCQNYDISQLGEGYLVEEGRLAEMMLSLQEGGCHNLNLVTPTHVVPQILGALTLARSQGLHLPIVYNCGGYESLSTLKMLEGIIEIYMPDAKYASGEVAGELSDAPDYPGIMKEALKEMHRQVGDLQMDARGVAVSGLLVRHLVLPHDLAGTQEIMRFLAQEVSRNTYVNIMDQYRPAFKAPYHLRMRRRITSSEYQEAIQAALQEGLHRGFPDHVEDRFL